MWRTGEAAYDEMGERRLGNRLDDLIIGFIYMVPTRAASHPGPGQWSRSFVHRWTADTWKPATT